jgi:hypothetical protein
MIVATARGAMKIYSRFSWRVATAQYFFHMLPQRSMVLRSLLAPRVEGEQATRR